jgi:hypothetical protein
MYWGSAGAGDSGSGAAVFSKGAAYQGVWHLEPALADAGGNAGASDDHGSADAAGAVGRGRHFNGTSAYIRLGKTAGLNVAGAVTMEAWARWLDGGTSGTMGRRHLLTHGNGAEGTKLETALRLLNANYFSGSYNGVSKTEAAATSPIAGDSAAWVHLAGVYDGASWRLYRNGAEVANKANAQGALASDSAWYLGAWSPSARYFSGDADEVRIASVAKGADWIKLEYASEKAGQTVVGLGPTQGSSSVRAATLARPVNSQVTWFDLRGKRLRARAASPAWPWERFRP